MVNQQLIDYVKHQREMGVSFDVIRNALIESGWPEADVDEATGRDAPRAPAPAPTPATPGTPKAGAVLTSDVFQTNKNDPIFEPKKDPSQKVSSAAKPGSSFFASRPGGAGTASGKSGSRSITRFIFPVILLLALGGLGWFTYMLWDANAALNGQITLLKTGQDSLTAQIKSITIEKEGLATRIADFDKEKQSILDELAIFKIPSGPLPTTPSPISVKGKLAGGTTYTVTTKNDIIIMLKNGKDAKVEAVLKPLVGSDVEISGEHVVGSRDITVQKVNGAAVQ